MEKAVWDFKANFNQIPNGVWDCLIAEFLLSEGRVVHSQEDVCKKYKVATLSELAAKQKEQFVEMPELFRLFTNIEMPLVAVLHAMEQEGIALDVAKLQKTGEEIAAATSESEDKIKQEIDYDINLNSSVQVGNYLAEKAGVPLSKTKTGRYATNESELSQFADQFPIVKDLLTYRGLTKLRSTYVDSLIEKVDEKGRVHTTYNQAAVSTGRLSSTNPNLQNIPVVSDFGQKIKACFVAGEGKVLLSFDYSQQELRILAHLTGEENLIAAFKNNQDVHKTTASKLFDVAYEEVTKQQRAVAKTVNFGIIYGMSSYGLSSGLHIPVEDAQHFIDAFYASYPKIKTFYEDYFKEAKINGFVKTLLGRRRFVFENGTPSFAKASEGQRKFIDNAMRRVLLNYPIQGTAADLMKKAMVDVYTEVVKNDSSVKLLLQIHDDLVFEVTDDPSASFNDAQDKGSGQVAAFIERVTKIMCSVYPLSVPIEVDVKKGKNWGEMQKIT